MPTVRTLQRQVEPTGLPSVRRTEATNPIAEGAAVGNAIAGFGETIERIGTKALDMHLSAQLRDQHEAKRKADTLAVIAYQNQLDAWKTEHVYNPETGALTKRGKDAFGLPEQVDEAFHTYANEQALVLSSDEQKIAGARIRAEEGSRLALEVRRHVDREIHTYTAEELQSRVKNEIEGATRDALEPTRIGGHIVAGEQAIEELGKQLGYGPEQLEEQKTALRSNIHVGVIDRLLSEQQTTAARAYFAEAKGEIAGTKLGAVEKAIRAGSVKSEAQKQSDAILAAGGTLTQQREKAKAIDDPDVRDAVLSYIEHEEVIREAEERDRTESRGRQVYDLLDTGRGIKAIPATVWSQMSGEERRAARSYAEHLAEGGRGSIKTDMATLYSLLTLSSTDQDTFLKTNLLGYRNHLSDGDLEQMMRKQAEMRNGKPATEVFASEGLQNEIINAGLSEMGIPSSAADLKDNAFARERVDMFRRAVREAVDREFPPSQGKRPLREDVQRIVDILIAPAGKRQTSMFGSTTGFAFEMPQARVTKAQDVPIAERRKIEDALRRNGITITDAKVMDLFNAQLSRVRGDR